MPGALSANWPAMPKNAAVTQLLVEWREGDRDALERLMPIVYDELRRLARRYLQSERPGHTLQATGLVNEAFARLAEADIPWQDRAHFFAVAARQMRRILIDHAKSRLRERRGGGAIHTQFDNERIAARGRPPDLLALDEALERLAVIDARKSDALVLHYFGGLSYDEIATALGISAATVDRDLRLGKAWLKHELADA